MTRYTELRHAGYYADGLTEAQRQAIADEVDGKPKAKREPKQTTPKPAK